MRLGIVVSASNLIIDVNGLQQLPLINTATTTPRIVIEEGATACKRIGDFLKFIY